MKFIELSKGKQAIVDDKDFNQLNRWKWHFDGLYATRDEPRINGKHGKKVYMHRQIMNFPKELVDHKNQDKLDNRRSNLRLSNKSQQMFNCFKRKTNTSGYKGVTWDKARDKWYAQIEVNGKRIFLGRYKIVVEAAQAYDRAARKYAKDFASINIS